jgi:hypothetical protein
MSSFFALRGDGNFLKARQEAKKGELDEQLRQRHANSFLDYVFVDKNLNFKLSRNIF